jgi:hypothetical protein
MQFSCSDIFDKTVLPHGGILQKHAGLQPQKFSQWPLKISSHPVLQSANHNDFYLGTSCGLRVAGLGLIMYCRHCSLHADRRCPDDVRAICRVYCTTRIWHSAILRSDRSVYLCVLCACQNKQRLFPFTPLTDRFFIIETEIVYCAVRTGSECLSCLSIKHLVIQHAIFYKSMDWRKPCTYI